MISDVVVTPRDGPMPGMPAMRRIVPRRLLAGALGLLCTIVAAANAQTTTGSVRGYVRGPNNAPVPDAQVAARNVAMGLNRGTTSNASGFYSLAGLRPGDYELTVRRLGFSPQTRTESGARSGSSESTCFRRRPSRSSESAACSARSPWTCDSRRRSRSRARSA